jgi:hypothetical protein
MIFIKRINLSFYFIMKIWFFTINNNIVNFIFVNRTMLILFLDTHFSEDHFEDILNIQEIDME